MTASSFPPSGSAGPGPHIHLPGLGPRPQPATKPKLQTAVQGDNIAVVSILDGAILDETNIAELGQELMNLVQKRYMIKMILDFAQVRYLSSAVLRELIKVHKAIQAEKGALKICNLRPDLQEVFTITQLDKVIEIKPDLVSALNSFKAKSWGFLKR
jgi:anti-sigma B factor antagonist